MVSQIILGAPGAQPTVLEAMSTSLTGVSADAKSTTNDSFLRHDTYFFKDGNITFLVDGTLYCVHRYFFSRDSVYFSTKFSQLGVRDHESLNTVISLSDVERSDFEAFLSVIYPTNFDEHNLSYDQWRSVLHLSTRWGFASLRKLALRLVKPPTPCDQLLLARTYGIDHWVLPSLSALCERTTPISLNEARQMRIEDVVLVATVREDIHNDGTKTEIPLRIEATQTRIAQTAGDVIGPASLKSIAVPKAPVLAEAVNAGPVAEGDSDNGSKTVATSPEEDNSDKRGSDEHLVSPSTVLASSKMQRIDKTQPPKAGASVVSLGENNKQEVEQQTQEATSENMSGDRVEEEHPSEPKDGTSEKESKKTEEETRETGPGVDLGADKVKAETAPSDGPHIASTITEEPEAQEQSKKPEPADEASAAPTISRSASIATEPQAPARATPLYWRRLTSRYMSVGPQPS
ncbi:hypothetical protein F5888DRAFT_774347 [Russula emetica]|nr:hypothetical protein F5888DRAFT_774347 [Russula emetica]